MLHALLRAHRRPLLSLATLATGFAPIAVASLFPCAATAQNPDVRIVRTPFPAMASIYTRSADRAVLGVLMAAGSRADTAGVHLEEVDANGPAGKAGLKAGDVLTEVNGVSLKVSKEDAEDLALAGLAQRRLQRVLGKVKPGEDVSLKVRTGSAAPRAVTLKTVSQAELDRSDTRRIVERAPMAGGRLRSAAGPDENRGMVGVTVGVSNSKRDTLGLFLNSVVSGGPAETAGIVEGERIAAVNGVDVRVPREDIDDMQAVSARVQRFVREVEKVAPGGTVTLRVYGNGRYREVAVKAGKASDMPHTSGFSMSIGDGMGLPRVLELGRDGPNGRIMLDGREMRLDTERLRESLQDMRRRIEDSVRDGVRDGTRAFEFREAPVVIRSRRGAER